MSANLVDHHFQQRPKKFLDILPGLWNYFWEASEVFVCTGGRKVPRFAAFFAGAAPQSSIFTEGGPAAWRTEP
jgi:hypothetical protein